MVAKLCGGACPVVGDHDRLQPWRKLAEGRGQRRAHLRPVQAVAEVGVVDQGCRRQRHDSSAGRTSLGNALPDRTGDRRHRRAAEPGAPTRVVPLQGSPQPEPPFVPGIGFRQLASPLPAHHPAH